VQRLCDPSASWRIEAARLLAIDSRATKSIKSAVGTSTGKTACCSPGRRRITRSWFLWHGTTVQVPTSTASYWRRSRSPRWARNVRSRRAATTRATHLPTLASRPTSPTLSSDGPVPADEPRDFYRNFYRTGRDPVEASSTVRHVDLQKPRSEALVNVDHHRSEILGSEFKSPLAHHKGAGQEGYGRSEVG
jgi:hypothetical protein